MSCLSFSDDDHVILALAGLILPQPTITAVLDVLGWLDVAAEIAAIDPGLTALAADVDAVDAPRHAGGPGWDARGPARSYSGKGCGAPAGSGT